MGHMHEVIHLILRQAVESMLTRCVIKMLLHMDFGQVPRPIKVGAFDTVRSNKRVILGE